MSRRVFLASRNAKKLEELRRILSEVVPDIEVVGLDDVEPYDEPAETEPTFEGNALIKARVGVRASHLPTLADDSGICVDELNGMPGVLSARWAGLAKDNAANNRLLLEQLHDTPADRRGAEFRCAVAFCMPDGQESVVFGEMRGSIVREPRGDGGFGYDPLFIPDGYDVTTAELPTGREGQDLATAASPCAAVAPMVAAQSLAGCIGVAAARLSGAAVLASCKRRGRNAYSCVAGRSTQRRECSQCGGSRDVRCVRWQGGGALLSRVWTASDENAASVRSARSSRAGGSRTHTGTDLNRVSLPLDYGPVG